MKAALDSWAVLRLLEGAEPAASRVQAVFDDQQPILSWINLGEVYYVVQREAATAIAHDATLLTGDPELLLDDAPWRFEDLRG